MPLPRSILCSSCKKTYPEGWRRCPYCGYDETRNRQESIGRRFLQKKIQEFEQRLGRERKEDRRPGGGRPPRPDTRPQPRGDQEAQSGAPPGDREHKGRNRRRRRRGGRPAAHERGSVPPPQQRSAPPQPKPPDGGGGREGGGGGRRRRRLRRGRGRGGGPPKPTSP